MKKMTYSWGEFYDTVSTCDEYTNDQRKQFAIFEALDKAITLKEIRKVLRRYKLSETEINRLNSSCLDGLLASSKYKKPLQKLIKSFPQYTETCKYYLKKGISKRCLLMACKYGREKIVELLLDRGADIHAKNDEPLHIACKTDNIETVKLLLDRGADIHADYDKALCWAIPIDIVKLLIDRGANVRTHNDITLRWASVNGYTEIVRLVLDKGADIHVDNDRPLLRASGNGHIETVKLLLDRGANIHANNAHALRAACFQNHYEIVKLFLDRGASIRFDAADRLWFSERDSETIKLLTERGMIPILS